MRIKLPSWLRKEAVALPAWARVGTLARTDVSIQVRVDTATAIEEWIGILGLKPEDVDQYWLEVIYQCIKLDVQTALAKTDFDPRLAGKAAEIKMERAEQYALNKFPDKHVTTMTVNGVRRRVSGIERATQGKEARGHYVRIRGVMPM